MSYYQPCVEDILSDPRKEEPMLLMLLACSQAPEVLTVDLTNTLVISQDHVGVVGNPFTETTATCTVWDIETNVDNTSSWDVELGDFTSELRALFDQDGRYITIACSAQDEEEIEIAPFQGSDPGVILDVQEAGCSVYEGDRCYQVVYSFDASTI